MQRRPAHLEPALSPFVSRDLVTFASEAELRAFAGRIDKVRDRRGRGWWSRRETGVRLAQADPVCTPDTVCPPNLGLEEIAVTAARAASPSITNNQSTGVDEGDVVKQIGDFLLVLQDGRIFSIDTRRGLTLADRLNVYEKADSGIWYDEMLVQDDRVIVTGYSYDEGGTELSVFRLDRATGTLRREGVFVISSDDYYDVDNYATRIVGDRLIIYTPYELDDLLDAKARPVVRRWRPQAVRDADTARERPLLDARDIYRPVQATWEPTVHTVSVCPLGRSGGTDLPCRATGFIGPPGAEMFVSVDDVFLWTWASAEDGASDAACAEGRAPTGEVLPAAVYRLSIKEGTASVAGARGRPFDQFSMDSRAGEFRALSAWASWRCGDVGEAGPEVALLKIPLRAFGDRFSAMPDRRAMPLPAPQASAVENRFAEHWLIYGGRAGWSGYPPDDGDPPVSARLIAAPLDAGRAPAVLSVDHSINRIELVGEDGVFINGYRTSKGLDVSLLKLGDAAQVVSTLHLEGRFESEGRSHAFNSLAAPDGGAIMGLPTVQSDGDAGRWWWRSDNSNVSFMRYAPGGRLELAGDLTAGEAEPNADYECEVSCIDWYGNSRPIFTGGRIFALMGTEIAEGRLVAGRMTEVRRLDLTVPRHP